MMRTSIGWLAVLILGAVAMACGSSPSVENTSGGSDNASSQDDSAAGSEGSAGTDSTGSAGTGSSGSGTASTGSGGGAGGGSNVPDCSKPEVLCPKEAQPMNDAACSCVTTKPCAYEVCGEPSPKGIFLATCDGKSWTIQETPCK